MTPMGTQQQEPTDQHAYGKEDVDRKTLWCDA